MATPTSGSSSTAAARASAAPRAMPANTVKTMPPDTSTMPSTKLATSSVSSRKCVIAAPAERDRPAGFRPAARHLRREQVGPQQRLHVDPRRRPDQRAVVDGDHADQLGQRHRRGAPVGRGGVAVRQCTEPHGQEEAGDRRHREEDDEQRPAEPELARAVLRHAPREAPDVDAAAGRQGVERHVIGPLRLRFDEGHDGITSRSSRRRDRPARPGRQREQPRRSGSRRRRPVRRGHRTRRPRRDRTPRCRRPRAASTTGGR